MEDTNTDEPQPDDELPSKWRKRLGLAGLVSLGGFVAWIFGRRDKPSA